MKLPGKVLAEGTLTNAKATIYTVGADKVAHVRFFSVFNTSGGTETVKIYVKPVSTSRQIYQAALLTVTGGRVISVGEILTLEAGDIIEGETTNTGNVTYVLTGLEES